MKKKGVDIMAEARKNPMFEKYSIISKYILSLENHIYKLKLKLKDKKRIVKIIEDHYDEYDL